METPTNTPTSKCYYDIRGEKREEYHAENCEHTPTTDSKNNSEDWEKKIKGQTILPYPHQDDGTYYPEFEKYGASWKALDTGDARAKNQVISYNRFRELIQHIAKEERRKTVEFIREKMGETNGDSLTFNEVLEAALETPHQEPEYIDPNPIKVRRETFKIKETPS